MSTSEATVKYLTLPHLLDDELENAIKLQVDAETAGSPYPLSAQHFIADRNAAGVRVGLVLFPKQTLHSLVEFCRSLETPLDGIEVEAASYFTTCTSSEQIPDTGAAVLDLRGDAFNLHVLGKLSPAFSRSVPVSSVWNAKPQEVAHAGAEPPVQGIPSPGHPTGTRTPVAPGRPDAQVGVSPSPARTCAFSALGIRSLAKEIHDTLQYLEFELRGSQVTKLILAGDMSRQDGLDRRLGLALGISVEALRLPSFLSPEAAGGTDPRLFGIALGASYGAF
jgi:Tfp pilus assembly PilM family ATPase